MHSSLWNLIIKLKVISIEILTGLYDGVRISLATRTGGLNCTLPSWPINGRGVVGLMQPQKFKQGDNVLDSVRPPACLSVRLWTLRPEYKELYKNIRTET